MRDAIGAAQVWEARHERQYYARLGRPLVGIQHRLVVAAYGLVARHTFARVGPQLHMLAIETPRLRLRPPESVDLDAFVEIHEDPEVLRYLTTVGHTSGRSAGWRIIALLIGHWHLRGFGQWTVIEKATNLIVGRVGPWYPEGWPGIELGWIIRRSHWNLGYATEAARAARDHAFSIVDAPHLISMIHPDNASSIRVAEKLGARVGRRDAFGGSAVLVYEIPRPEGIRVQPPAAAAAASVVSQQSVSDAVGARVASPVATSASPVATSASPAARPAAPVIEEPDPRPFRDLPTSISGRLLDRRGRPAPKYVVVIFAADRTQWSAEPDRVKHTRPSSNGQYVVSGLPAGDYFVGAVTDLEPDDLGDAGFLKMLSKSATRVTLDAGGKRTLDLQIGGRV